MVLEFAYQAYSHTKRKAIVINYTQLQLKEFKNPFNSFINSPDYFFFMQANRSKVHI